MLAQKTPSSAKLINISDSWNSLYFQELHDFQFQIFEDYKLRLLFICYLFKQRFWLQRFSIKRINGYYSIQIFVVSVKPQLSLLPLLLDVSNYNNIITTHFDKIDYANKYSVVKKTISKYRQTILPLYIYILQFPIINLLELRYYCHLFYNNPPTVIEKFKFWQTNLLDLQYSVYLNYQNYKIQLNSFKKKNKLIVMQHNKFNYSYSFGPILPFRGFKLVFSNLFLKKFCFLKNKKRNKFSINIFRLGKLIISKKVLFHYLANFYIIIKQISKLYFRQKWLRYYFRIFSYLKLKSVHKRLVWQRKLVISKDFFSSSKIINLQQHKLYKINQIYIGCKDRYNVAQLVQARKVSLAEKVFSKRYSSISYQLVVKLNNRCRSLYALPLKVIFFILQTFKKFYLRRQKSWGQVILTWIKKRGFRLRFRKNLVRRFLWFSYYKIAAERLTKTCCFCTYRISLWGKIDYNRIKRYVIFERFRIQPFFIHLLVATHYSISQGVPSVLIEFLRNSIGQLVHHNKILEAVCVAFKYFLCWLRYTTLKPSCECQGARIFVIGKVDGSERKKKWAVRIGSIPTSSFNVNIRYDQTTIITRYGSLHIHLWLYFPSLVF